MTLRSLPTPLGITCAKPHWTLTVAQALACWPVDIPCQLLHSGRAHPQYSQWSFITSPTTYVRYCPHHHWTHSNDIEVDNSLHAIDAFEAVIKQKQTYLWTGYLSYDLARDIEQLPNDAPEDRHWPWLDWHASPGWLAHHPQHGWHAYGTWATHPELCPDLHVLHTSKQTLDPVVIANDLMAHTSDNAHLERIKKNKSVYCCG